MGVVVSPLGPPLVYGARCGSRGSGSIPEGLVPRLGTEKTYCEPFDWVKRISGFVH